MKDLVLAALLEQAEKKAAQISLPSQGEKVLIPNWEHLEVKVSALEPIAGAIKIHLDWGIHGHSYVMLHDEGKTWRRAPQLN